MRTKINVKAGTRGATCFHQCAFIVHSRRGGVQRVPRCRWGLWSGYVRQELEEHCPVREKGGPCIHGIWPTDAGSTTERPLLTTQQTRNTSTSRSEARHVTEPHPRAATTSPARSSFSLSPRPAEMMAALATHPVPPKHRRHHLFAHGVVTASDQPTALVCIGIRQKRFSYISFGAGVCGRRTVNS